MNKFYSAFKIGSCLKSFVLLENANYFLLYCLIIIFWRKSAPTLYLTREIMFHFNFFLYLILFLLLIYGVQELFYLKSVNWSLKIEIYRIIDMLFYIHFIFMSLHAEHKRLSGKNFVFLKSFVWKIHILKFS